MIVEGAIAEELGIWNLDFGNVTIGEVRERALVVRNEGGAPMLPNPKLPAPFSAHYEGEPLHPGETGSLLVRFHPEEEGRVELIVPLDGQRLRLVGRSVPCTLRVGASEIDFGHVATGDSVERSLLLSNVGEGLCSATLTVDGAGFLLPGGDRIGLLPGLGANVPIRFTAESGAGEGTLIVAAGQMRHEVRLNASTFGTCVTVEPPSLSFDLSAGSCGFQSRQLEVRNDCPDSVPPIQLTAARLPPDSNFAVTGAFFSLPSGESRTLEVTFLPRAAGEVDERLQLQFGEGMGVEVQLDGVAGPRLQSWFQEFVAETPPKLDVLVVVDDSSAFQPFEDLVGEIASVIVDRVRYWDFALGVTTASLQNSAGCNSSARGLLLEGDGRPVLRATDADWAVELEERMRVPACQEETTRRPLDVAVNLLEMPNPLLRDDASLHVLFLAAGDDVSPGNVADYRARLRELNLTARADAWRDCSSLPSRLGNFALGLGGRAVPMCSNSLGSISLLAHPEPIFELRRAPHDLDGDGLFTEEAGELRVEIGGEPFPAWIPDVEEPRWFYDSVMRAIRFSPPYHPAPEARVRVFGTRRCDE